MVETYPFIDTHTHFDVDCFAHDREEQAIIAYQTGVRHLLLIGFLAKNFPNILKTQQQLQEFIQKNKQVPQAHTVFGLHPCYIEEQTTADLEILAEYIQRYSPIAIGEIGLDTFDKKMKQPEIYIKQQTFFIQQLELAKVHQLPIILHIRKSHADVLKILKNQMFNMGGIAHSFSGGIQEAKAFVKLGFKIGITGQITNPNAKKLRTTVVELVKHMGLEHIVIETDCPDMTPVNCYQSHQYRNVPANLIHVFNELATLLNLEKAKLAKQLWCNSTSAFATNWQYPHE